MSSSLTIKHICALSRAANYSPDAKERYRKASMSYLRAFAKRLGLASGTYQVRFNRGDIAVSGDAILHHDSFYLNVSSGAAYWRTCQGREDYSGGTNQWICGLYANHDDAWLFGSVLGYLNRPALIEVS